MPRFSEDDVMDFLVTEALVVKAGHERKSAEKEKKRTEWRKDHKNWAKENGLV